VDLREIARGRRRRQGLEALEFERDREAALHVQLEETITELEGASVDNETFARMAPDDVDIVRQTLFDMGDAFEPGVDGEADEDWLGEFMQGESPEVDREERLEEVARLEEEIEESKRRQQALERYLAALTESSPA
jgi:hypothetical protein